MSDIVKSHMYIRMYGHANMTYVLVYTYVCTVDNVHTVGMHVRTYKHNCSFILPAYVHIVYVYSEFSHTVTQ